jgi:small subunit ribosomal protein S11e
MTEQQERGFQKQPTIFQNRKRPPGLKKINLKRYTRTVGLGFKMPAEVNASGRRATLARS